jgi:hypothetical protein
MDLPPDPAALIQSMRAFGYTLPTALADLIDNSISAGASQIDAELRWDGPSSTVSITDDGCGMDEGALTQAMRLGSRSPEEERAPTDLGRFGLGLKSAAWSQARSLTVLTRTGGGPVLVARWDLDHLTRTGTWSLLGTTTQAGEASRRRLQDTQSGTVVPPDDPLHRHEPTICISADSGPPDGVGTYPICRSSRRHPLRHPTRRARRYAPTVRATPARSSPSEASCTAAASGSGSITDRSWGRDVASASCSSGHGSPCSWTAASGTAARPTATCPARTGNGGR